MAGKVTVKKQAVVSVKAKPTKKYAKNLKAGEEAELKSMGLFKICVNSISNDTKKVTVGNNEIQELQLTALLARMQLPKLFRASGIKLLLCRQAHLNSGHKKIVCTLVLTWEEI